MITPPTLLLHFFFFSISLLISSISALNSDGTFLLSFKHSLLSNPSSLLHNWNHSDATPCAWTGVTCAPQNGSVISLLLPNSHLHGSIPNDFGLLHHLRSLDLSNNSINGNLPTSLFNCSDLQMLSLSSNLISGDLPELISKLQKLRVLNLSDNGFSGGVPGGFDSVEVLDLSSNLFNGVLPIDFGGGRLKYLNLSNNKLSGAVFPQFAEKIPANAVVDLSFNSFTGEIPQTMSFSNQKTEYFAGNLDLCGKPLKKMCIVPSSLSTQHNNVSSESSPTAAIAVIPKPAGKSNNHGGRKVNSRKIAAIVVGDVASIVLLAVFFFYACQFRKKKRNQNPKALKIDESRNLFTTCSCLNGFTGEETSENESESNGEDDVEEKKNCLVMVDGETELEMETLLKASAYVLGSKGESIVYKAVVGGGGGDGGGAAFAVRRIGESGVEKMKEFEKIVRVMGKFQHPNLVRVRGFYWGEEEKLVIYDYVSNGSLAAAAAYKKDDSSSCHLSFEVRLKIAKGIAKGLFYIHEKKHVHGNIKPSNILLTSEMDPVISDFGLEWIKSGKSNSVTHKATGNFVKIRSTSSSKFINTFVVPPTSLVGCVSLYQAPESMTSLKPNPKWDVYSFGIILLELLLGKAFSDDELGQWNSKSSIIDSESKILKIIDGFITINANDKKESIITCFKLGFRCASLTSQKRPSMKEALQVLEKIPCPS